MLQGTHGRTGAAQVRRAHRLGCGVPQPGLAGVVAPRHSTRPVVAASPPRAGWCARSIACAHSPPFPLCTNARALSNDVQSSRRRPRARLGLCWRVVSHGLCWRVVSHGLCWRVVSHGGWYCIRQTTAVRPTGAGFGGVVLFRCFSRPSRRTAVPCGLAVLRYAADTQRATRRRPRGD